MSRCWCNWDFQVLGASHDDFFEAETSSFKQFSLKKLFEPLLDLGILHNFLSISPSRDSRSELLIRSFRVFLYLLEIATILEFPFLLPITYLTTQVLKIIIIRFWYGRKILGQVFPRQIYASIKQTLSIYSIVYQPYAYQYLSLSQRLKPNCVFFEQQIQITQTHFQIFNCNSKHSIYNPYYFSTKKKEKMRYMRFLPKDITICFGEEIGFDYKNNYRQNNLVNFQLDTIS